MADRTAFSVPLAGRVVNLRMIAAPHLRALARPHVQHAAAISAARRAVFSSGAQPLSSSASTFLGQARRPALLGHSSARNLREFRVVPRCEAAESGATATVPPALVEAQKLAEEASVVRTIYLKDYKPLDYQFDTVDLKFELGEEVTLVTAKSVLKAREGLAGRPPLVLDGEAMECAYVAIDGKRLVEGVDYAVTEHKLAIAQPPAAASFTLEIQTRIKPQENTTLTGLYKSSGNFCTQCEAEGFRRITFFHDRPDNMAIFTTTVIADKSKYPYLLSNGNPVESGELEGGRHFVRWEDPFRKPSYLFALVAGRLAKVADTYTTGSGREVALHFFVEAGKEGQVGHAVQALKDSMRWDEERYGLEYDLDLYMVVAVSDFTMGAMENKGLNIFNDKYVLADPRTATDGDFDAVQSVIGHEYFHNYTGNRVTCRDWFQLSLKEGLTVFRDQEFSGDMLGGSRALKRISDVNRLRLAQFPQDASPMAHPVRPDQYIEINNFYTATVYEKGAEVVRMIHTLVGAEAFRRGMDLYFARHDGQAVTIEDFAGAMQDASGVDLTQFKTWYSQSGTPVLTASTSHDAAAGTFTVTLAQRHPATPNQPAESKRNLHIPVRIALLDRSTGADSPLRIVAGAVPAGMEAGATEAVLELKEGEQSWTFAGFEEAPVPSLLRSFSAPVALKFDPERLASPLEGDLLFRMARDSDGFNRWDAAQQLAAATMLRMVAAEQAGSAAELDAAYLGALRAVLAEALAAPEESAKGLLAALLSLPSESYIAQLMAPAPVDPAAIHAVSRRCRRQIASALRDELLRVYCENAPRGPYAVDAASKGRRALRNVALGYLVELASGGAAEADYAEPVRLAAAQFRDADNMTDQARPAPPRPPRPPGGAGALSNAEACGAEREAALAAFYEQWKGTRSSSTSGSASRPSP
eukprot:tig00021537_g22258.t1